MRRSHAYHAFIPLLPAIIIFSCKKEPSIAPPADLSFTNISDTGATITWNTVGNATAYSVYIATDINFNDPVNGYGPSVVQKTSLVVNNLIPATKYFVKVIATINSDYNYNLYANHAKDESIAWPYLTGGNIYGSPVVVDSMVYVAGDDGYVYAPISSSTEVFDGAVYFGDVDGVYSLDAATGNLLWENKNVGTGTAAYSGPTVTDNFVYAGSVRGTLYCLDRTTGATIWANALPAADFQASPCILKYSGKVYYPGVSGMVQ